MKRTKYFTRKERIGIWRIKDGVPQYFSKSSMPHLGWCRSLYSVDELLAGPGRLNIMSYTGHGIFATSRDDARNICPEAFRQ